MNSTGRENDPMKTRMMIGTTVHATSSGELWVNRAGVALDRWL